MSTERTKYSKIEEAERGDGDEDTELAEVELHEGQQPVTTIAESEDAITVKVKSTDEKTHDVRVSASSTVLQLKKLLHTLTGFPAERQRLICLGKLLADEKSLEESSVKDGHFVHLVPKPAASAASSSSSSSSSVRPSDNDELHLPAHIREMFGNRNTVSGLSSDDLQFSFEEEYELNIWRYRVRVLSMVMMFYYSLSLLTSLSVWIALLTKTEEERAEAYPTNAQFRQVKTDIPLTLLDTLENVMGTAAALVGMRSAVSNSPVLAKRFAREMGSLSIVHAANLVVWIVALYRGEIVEVPLHHRGSGNTHTTHSELEESESVHAIVSTMLIVHFLMWASILSIAFRYYKTLAYRAEVLRPEQSDPVAPSSSTMSNLEVV